MKDSLAITAQAIPFLNDFKNYGKLIKKIKIMRNLQLKTDALPSEFVSGKFKNKKYAIKLYIMVN